jgi:hypothetical protein
VSPRFTKPPQPKLPIASHSAPHLTTPYIDSLLHTINDKRVERAIDLLVKALPQLKREKKKSANSSGHLQQVRCISSRCAPTCGELRTDGSHKVFAIRCRMPVMRSNGSRRL